MSNSLDQFSVRRFVAGDSRSQDEESPESAKRFLFAEEQRGQKSSSEEGANQESGDQEEGSEEGRSEGCTSQEERQEEGGQEGSCQEESRQEEGLMPLFEASVNLS